MRILITAHPGVSRSLICQALLANLYNMENLAYRFGLGSHGPEVNIIVVGTVLVLAGVGFGLAGLAGRRAR